MTDLLVVAGLASAILERHGFIACGRRENGVARVDFWTRDGLSFRHELTDTTVTPDEVAAACMVLAGRFPSETSLPTSALN